ncbi:hypothetical protein BC940DRAFT_313632 [Gongronella butleri]|nr:hypothetical protein BC940DRAFT_313632 [Gongronella butleri]
MDDYAVDNTTLSTVPHNNMSLSLSYGSALDYSSSLYTSPLAHDANDANHLHAYGGVCRVAPTALATTTVTPVAADGANSERVIAGFVAKLYQCLQTTENGESYARWCRHDGKDMFVIDCIPKFTEQVLPKLFKHCKFPSFVRQLNQGNQRRANVVVALVRLCLAQFLGIFIACRRRRQSAATITSTTTAAPAGPDTHAEPQ